ncbi:MAG: FAD:protein FMN transferase [Verrucomicrobia bacterium]|nr:FAD:protein FMN transferase [Verrucomicrobiota bacterium]
MGTFASLTVSAPTAASLPANATLTRDTFEALNQSLSTYIASSDISRLNAAAGQDPIPVSPDTTAMLALATRFSDLSGGAFDVTVLPLMQLWGFRNGQPPTALPDPVAVAATLPLVNYQSVEQGGGSAGLAQAGMQIDLGGIAKGYAVDRAFDLLQRTGQHNLLINLGGNMRALGRPEPSRPWRVGVRNPFNRSELLGTIDLPNGYAVATSGNYEKFVELDGTRYAHIMDPRNGRPVQGIAAVTILAPTAVAADALSTALFVVGLDGAPTILAHVPNTHALIVPDRHPIQIHLSPALAPRFTPLPTYKKSIHSMP